MRGLGHLDHDRGQPSGGGQALHLVRHLALLVGLVVQLAEDQHRCRARRRPGGRQQRGDEKGGGAHGP